MDEYTLEERIKKTEIDFKKAFTGESAWDRFAERTRTNIREHIASTNNESEVDFEAIPLFFPSHVKMLLLITTSPRKKHFLELEFEDRPSNLREALEELFLLLIVDLYHEVLAEYDEIAED